VKHTQLVICVIAMYIFLFHHLKLRWCKCTLLVFVAAVAMETLKQDYGPSACHCVCWNSGRETEGWDLL